jgi:cytochrome b6-f complex iron-sulfur subunit
MTERPDFSPTLSGEVSRRTFLSTAWLIMGTLAAGEAAYLGLRFLGSRRTVEIFGEVINAGTVSEFPPGSITLFNEARFFLVRFDDGGFLALHNRCTHLACVVSWDDRAHEFRCPCHGSTFNQSGKVMRPPAPRALDHFPVIIDSEDIKVDTGRPLRPKDGGHVDRIYVPEVKK